MKGEKQFQIKEQPASPESQIIEGLKAKGIDDPEVISLLSELIDQEKNTLHPDDFKVQYRYSLEKKKADIYLKAGYPEKALEILSSAILRAEEKKDTELGLGIIEEIKQCAVKIEDKLKQEKEAEEERNKKYEDRTVEEIREKIQDIIRRIHKGVEIIDEETGMWGISRKEHDLIEEAIRSELNYDGHIGHNFSGFKKEEMGVDVKHPEYSDITLDISVEFEK